MPRPISQSTEKPSKPSKPGGSAGKGKGPAKVQTKPCDQGNITLDNLSSKIDKLTDIVGPVVSVVKELKAYDEAGEPADDGEREQSSDEDEQPPTKKEERGCTRVGSRGFPCT